MRAMRLALVAVAIMALTGWAYAENLLTNPGFEDAEGNGRAVGWAFSGQAETVTDAAIAHSGERCAKGRFDDAVSQRIEVEPGSSYRITGWIRRVDPAGQEVPKIKVYFLGEDGREVEVQATEFHDVPANDWDAWESMMRAPETATSMNLTLRGFFGGSQFFYWDDLSVEKVEAPEWPIWDKTPDLGGKTVTVPDLADIWTDALLRIPPGSLVQAGRTDSDQLRADPHHAAAAEPATGEGDRHRRAGRKRADRRGRGQCVGGVRAVPGGHRERAAG